MDAVANPTTLQAAIEFFANPVNCLTLAIQQRCPDGVVTCPTCNRPDPAWLAKQQRFQCKAKHAQRQFSVKNGTIMEDSPLPLRHWMLAMWMASNCKNGVSSYEISRALHVTQKTAWFLLHRIRLAMQATDGGKLGGEVEVDESFIGGKARNMHASKRERVIKGRRGWAGKAAVMGLLARHEGKGKSRVRTKVVNTTRRHELSSHIEKHVEDGSKVYTDALKSYDNLGLYYQHQVVDHAECYVRGEVHTNGLENFWALLKRSIKGTYVNVEPFHLFRYLDEQSFRFNERSLTDGERFAMTLRQVVGRRVTYKALTGKESAA